MTEDDDLQLVEETRKGNHDAFGRLVEKYQRRVFGIVFHYLGPGGDIEDVAQEVFIKIYAGLNSFDGSKPFAPWAYRIAVNKCLDELRRRRQHRSVRFSELTESEESQVQNLLKRFQSQDLGDEDAAQSAAILDRVLNRLNEKDRMAFVLREIEELEYARIAELMKTSENGVRIRVFRARRRLKELYLKAARTEMIRAGG